MHEYIRIGIVASSNITYKTCIYIKYTVVSPEIKCKYFTSCPVLPVCARAALLVLHVILYAFRYLATDLYIYNHWGEVL